MDAMKVSSRSSSVLLRSLSGHQENIEERALNEDVHREIGLKMGGMLLAVKQTLLDNRTQKNFCVLESGVQVGKLSLGVLVVDDRPDKRQRSQDANSSRYQTPSIDAGGGHHGGTATAAFGSVGSRLLE